MDRIDSIAATATAPLQHRSSQTDRTESIPRDKMMAMGDVFDRWRLNQGWNPWDNDTQMAAIKSWVHTLDIENIPASAYGPLYERALLRRATAINQGRTIPTFGVELMLAEWMGENGYQRELRQKEIDAGRTLGANAESVCQHCHGSGFKFVDGGVTKCDHA